LHPRALNSCASYAQIDARFSGEKTEVAGLLQAARKSDRMFTSFSRFDEVDPRVRDRQKGGRTDRQADDRQNYLVG